MLSDRLLEIGFAFHGHRCPAMPLGVRAGLAAMEALDVERSKDKELHCICETGSAHATMCFVDGVQVATGCTYGKANIERVEHCKNAITLTDVATGRAVRVAVRADFLKKALQSEFVELRARGVPPQDVAPEVVEPLIERVWNAPTDSLFTIGPVRKIEFRRTKGTFDWHICENCGEIVFEHGVRLVGGRKVCLGCVERTRRNGVGR